MALQLLRNVQREKTKAADPVNLLRTTAGAAPSPFNGPIVPRCQAPPSGESVRVEPAARPSLLRQQGGQRTSSVPYGEIPATQRCIFEELLHHAAVLGAADRDRTRVEGAGRKLYQAAARRVQQGATVAFRARMSSRTATYRRVYALAGERERDNIIR